ncbi:unnamed protein product [Cuscuta europaea]|uniref:Uncharacterized protein n=1 Tax=Cuscuta europaea TaxID=41803 RepID=A0A9P1E1D0_CUSEU|nr:unnamed protein product [Cuscuta europaea]
MGKLNIRLASSRENNLVTLDSYHFFPSTDLPAAIFISYIPFSLGDCTHAESVLRSQASTQTCVSLPFPALLRILFETNLCASRIFLHIKGKLASNLASRKEVSGK